MNAIDSHRHGIDPQVWEDPVMRLALAVRDITTVYRLLQKAGFSQQRIAAMTGQSQPEVSAIIHGQKVKAYDVLSRICDGLGAPRSYMGLACCTCHTTQPDTPGTAAGHYADRAEAAALFDQPTALSGEAEATTPRVLHRSLPFSGPLGYVIRW